MKNKWITLFVIAIGCNGALSSCNSCNQNSNDNDDDVSSREIVDDQTPSPLVEQGEIEFTEEMEIDLKAKLNKYLTASGDGRFQDMIDLSHPYMFVNDAEKKLALEEMKEFWNRGARSGVVSYDLKYVSPMQDIDSLYVMLIKWDVEAEMYFLDNFDGIVSNYNASIREKYLYCDVTFDEKNKRYSMIGEQQAYAFTPKDKPDFFFISTAMIQSPRISVMIDIQTINKLRKFQ